MPEDLPVEPEVFDFEKLPASGIGPWGVYSGTNESGTSFAHRGNPRFLVEISGSQDNAL
jgi:hypothetical protein